MKHPIGATITSAGWPFIWTVTGIKIPTRRTRERLYRVTTNPGWAASLTTTIPASRMRTFTDNRTKRGAHA